MFQKRGLTSGVSFAADLRELIAATVNTAPELAASRMWRLGTFPRATPALERLKDASELTFEGVDEPLAITPGEVRYEPIEASFEDGIATIRIRTFATDAHEDFVRIVTELKASHGDALEGVIIDLRQNGGGFRTASVRIAQDLAEQGEIFSSKGRDFRHTLKQVNATATDVLDGLPIVVQVDENSASASEIVAQGLAYAGRAVVVGSRTYGKGSVQTQGSLDNGGRFNVTVARYYGAGGISARILRDPAVYASLLTPMDGLENVPIATQLDFEF